MRCTPLPDILGLESEGSASMKDGDMQGDFWVNRTLSD